ncbi:MAG: hypothetical protein EA383_11620 [Spirochaetaceae bacterium]|nr:MAG: hypothetical protein EA383_11620 [Spirochaetaceae bacterium]
MPQTSRRRTIIIILAIFAVLAGSLFTSAVQTAIAQRVVAHITARADMSADISGVRVRPNGRITLDEAVLYDSQGREAVRTARVSVSLSLRGLLLRSLVIENVSVEQLSITLTDSITEDLGALRPEDREPGDWTVTVDTLSVASFTAHDIADLSIPELRAHASGVRFADGLFTTENAGIESEHDTLSLSGQAQFPDTDFELDLSFTLSRQTIADLGPEISTRLAAAGSVSGELRARGNEAEISIVHASLLADEGFSLEASGTAGVEEVELSLAIESLEIETRFLQTFAPALAVNGLPDRTRASGTLTASPQAAGLSLDIETEVVSGDIRVRLEMLETGEAGAEIRVATDRDIPSLNASLRITGVFAESLLELHEPEHAVVSGQVSLAGYLEGEFTLRAAGPAIAARVEAGPVPDLLTELFPALPAVSELQADLVVSPDEVTLDLHVSSVVGDGYELLALRIEAEGRPDAFTYRVSVDEVALANARVYEVTSTGQLDSGELVVAVSTEDLVGNSLLTTELAVAIGDGEFTVSFTEAGLTVRDQRWTVPETNQIFVSRESVRVRDMILEQDDARIRIDAGDDGNRVILMVEGFSLSRQIPVELDFDLQGIVDANFEIELQPDLTGDFEVRIRDLGLADLPPGRLLVTGSIGEILAADILFEQDTGQITSSIQFDTAREDIEILIDIESVDLSLLAGIIPQEIEEASGRVNGSIAIRGSVLDPEFSGSLTLDNASIRPSRLGVTYRLEAEELSVEGTLLQVAGLSVQDETGGSAELSGTVLLDLSTDDIIYDLSVRAENLTVLDTGAAMNPDLYGTVSIGANLRLSGSLAEPVLSGELRVEEGTEMTIQLPRRGLQRGRGAGIVRFQGETAEAFMQDDTEPLVQGIDLTGSLSVAPDANVNIIIDPRTGDQLQLQGGGDFSIGIDPSGTVDLSGVYTVERGQYELQFLGLVERSFDIRPGGTITWSGAFEDADLDLAAEYSIRTSPAPLLNTGGESVPAGNLTFLVVLELDGTLLEPDVRLSLDMPEEQRSALGGRPYTALQNINLQESQRNTQAFALVVLNQFFQDDVTAFDEAAVFTAGTRGSVSELLTYQLNILSQRVLPGLDLAFDVDSFEEVTEEGPEGRTEVQVQVSQQLFDDQLIVRFGGQLDVERAGAGEAEAADIGTSASVEYALTEDGRFRIRAFFDRSPGADDAGTVTGISFIFGRDFDPFDNAESDE